MNKSYGGDFTEQEPQGLQNTQLIHIKNMIKINHFAPVQSAKEKSTERGTAVGGTRCGWVHARLHGVRSLPRLLHFSGAM